MFNIFLQIKTEFYNFFYQFKVVLKYSKHYFTRRIKHGIKQIWKTQVKLMDNYHK